MVPQSSAFTFKDAQASKSVSIFWILTPLTKISPRSSNTNPHSARILRVASGTWMRPLMPVLSMRLARFTVDPQMSYCGLVAPITPATTGPWAIPVPRAQSLLRTPNIPVGSECACAGVSVWGHLLSHLPTRSWKFLAECLLTSFKVCCIAKANKTSSLRWFHSFIDVWGRHTHTDEWRRRANIA